MIITCTSLPFFKTTIAQRLKYSSFRVSGFGVQGRRVSGVWSGFRFWVSGFGIQCEGLKCRNSGIRVQGVGFRAPDSKLRGKGVGYQGLGFRG